MQYWIRSQALKLMCVASLFLLAIPPALSQRMSVKSNVHHDVSPAVRDLPKVRRGPVKKHEAKPVRRIPLPPGLKPAGQPDRVLQKPGTKAPSKLSPATNLGFDGIGQGVSGFNVSVAPPDTNGAVGISQYVQIVNDSFAVFSKTDGTILAGPTATNALWKGFGGGCETNDDGDPIVLYDKLAN